MNTNDLRARAPERGIAQRSSRSAARGRASSLIVAGVFLAFFGTVLVVASSPDNVLATALGLGLFIAGAAIGAAFTSNLPPALTVTAAQSEGAANGDNPKGASTRWSIRDSFASVQFGPDPEQVIGRQTGART